MELRFQILTVNAVTFFFISLCYRIYRKPVDVLTPNYCCSILLEQVWYGVEVPNTYGKCGNFYFYFFMVSYLPETCGHGNAELLLFYNFRTVTVRRWGVQILRVNTVPFLFLFISLHHHIYLKSMDALTQNYSLFLSYSLTPYWFVRKAIGWVANNVDPDQTPHSAASGLDLPVCSG